MMVVMLCNLTGGFTSTVFRHHPSPFLELSPGLPLFNHFVISVQLIKDGFVTFSF